MALTILIVIVALGMAVIANCLLAPSAPSIDRNLFRSQCRGPLQAGTPSASSRTLPRILISEIEPRAVFGVDTKEKRPLAG
jgi:hypothetical protein